MTSTGFSPNRHVHLILLKSPSPTASGDPYTAALSTLTSPLTTPVYVPVLSHSLHPDVLIRLLLAYFSPSSNAIFPFGGIILTSQRAVAALSAALASPPCTREREKNPEEWRKRAQNLRLRLYTVGAVTAKAAREVQEKHLPGCRVLGAEKAGSGEALARLILGDGDRMSKTSAGNSPSLGMTEGNLEQGKLSEADEDDSENYNSWPGAYFSTSELSYPSLSNAPITQVSRINTRLSQEGEETQINRENKGKKPLLFPTTSTHNPILPRALTEAPYPNNIAVQIENVYETGELDSFAHHIAQVLSTCLSSLPSSPPQHEPPSTSSSINNGAVWTKQDSDANEISLPMSTSSTTIIIILFSPLPSPTLFTALSNLPSSNSPSSTSPSSSSPPLFPFSSTTNRFTGPRTHAPDGKPQKERIVIGCIGPTTEKYLRDTIGYEADFVAEKPSPLGLRIALEVFLRS